ncbi:MAG: hypothetical protein WCC59_14465 [Terriglobales bacterium]
MPNHSLRAYHTLEAITQRSLFVKVGGTAIGIFWFLQLVKDELLPEEWEGKLRLLNLLPHLHWYIWVILFLSVLLIGLVEGAIRWNSKDIAPILGWPGSLQNDAFQTASKMRDFIRTFISNNSEMPTLIVYSDEEKTRQAHREISEWCVRFTMLFRTTLDAEVRSTMGRIRAEGVPMDFSIMGLLDQASVSPDAVMSLAGLLMGAGLSLSLKKRSMVRARGEGGKLSPRKKS